MGIVYRCDADLGCTFVVWGENVSPEQWRAHRERLWADPAFPPGPKTLADLRLAGSALQITSASIGEMADLFRARGDGPSKVAAVPNAAWDKTREFERAVEGSGITVISFTEIVTACAWLGIDAHAAQTILAELREQLAKA